MISPNRWLTVALIFKGEYDRHMLRNRSQSTQHGDVILIDETNIFFILLTIILQVLDRCTHELKVSCFSAYLLFFLAIASKRRELTASIHLYFNRRCPPSPCHAVRMRIVVSVAEILVI
jgi:hypothetical protein